ncbi:hypothetical protein BGX34_003852 [Mortierella sp. NVP85]|nr:hypothetical protein BGX34_003852 [Mortierella sp. NVP85]
MDSLHKTLSSIETSGSQDQRKWAAQTKKILKDPSQAEKIKQLFQKPSEDAQDQLADAIITGTANALEKSITPVLHSVGKRVLARTGSNDSASSAVLNASGPPAVENSAGSMVLPTSSPVLPTTTMAAYALYNQRIDWNDQVITAFDQYVNEHQDLSDVGGDFIMDITAGSSLVKSLPDHIYGLVESDAPTLPDSFAELVELNELISGKSSFQALQDLVYSIPLNTKVRRFLYASVQGYAKYFPRHSHLPDKDERQLMIDVVDPVLQGAFDVFDMSRNVSEVAIVGSGERRNLEKTSTEKIDRCKRADFVGYDHYGRQIVLAECSTLYETDTRKLWADRWKLSRAMKDTLDSTMKKYGESVRPHSRFSVFGIQTFGQKVTLLQMDFRNHYRLWQLAWVDVPTNQTEFELTFSSYVRKVLCFAKLVKMESTCREQQPRLSDREVVALSRAQHRLVPTTPSPRNSLKPSSARQPSK